MSHYLTVETKTSLMCVHLLCRALTTNGMRNRAAEKNGIPGSFKFNVRFVGVLKNPIICKPL